VTKQVFDILVMPLTLISVCKP